MSVETKGHQPQLPGDEIENMARSPRVAAREIVETKVARRVHELNAGIDLVTLEKDFPSREHKADWERHTHSQITMGD